MARRTTTTPKKQSNAPDAEAFELLEPVTPKAPRRGRKAAGRAAEPMEVADEALLPGVQDESPAPEPSADAKPRRGRKPKNTPPPKATAPEERDDADPEAKQPDMLADTAPPPAAEPTPEAEMPVETSTASSHDAAAPAASWDATTGTVTFDWPGIEKVAAAEGPNQAMARLLLAARAEGANSRWPFSPTGG